jgi:hypothetical protein
MDLASGPEDRALENEDRESRNRFCETWTKYQSAGIVSIDITISSVALWVARFNEA